MTAYLLYSMFAIGGMGIYLMLPKAEVSRMRAGAVIALLGVVGLFTVLATRVISPGETTAYFYLFSGIAVLAGARMITHPKPVYCALYFVLTVIAVAALLVLLQAEFLAVALIIVYAGAILVTYLFVIMLAQQSGSPVYDRRSREPFLAAMVGFVLTAAIAGRAETLPLQPPVAIALLGITALSVNTEPESNTAAIGQLVMTRYVVVLEIAGVLLLVSMIGAIAMSRKKVPVERHDAPGRPIGQIGREVEPY